MKYIDLGLPSGTLWAESNEEGYYNFDEAVEKYGDAIPTKEQFEELKNLCQWTWIGKGYKVMGPNGNSITLPAEGIRSCFGNEYYVYYVGYDGFYCSSTPHSSDHTWTLYFYSGSVYMDNAYRCHGISVRLVK